MAVKKKQFEIEIPLLNTVTAVPAFNLAALDGKTIKLDLTRMLKGKSIEAIFTVKVEGEKAIAVPKKLNLMFFYIRRMIRKNISYVEDSFVCSCTDGRLRIKTFMITRKRVHKSVRKALREKARQDLIDFCKEKTKEDFLNAVIGNTIQKELAARLKKIYPLALCEIRAVIPGK